MATINSFIQFENFNVRIAGTSEEPLFCAKDVCDVLGLCNSRKATSAINSKFTASLPVTGQDSRPRPMTFLKEPGLYMLIMKTRKPQAAPFQEWVCGEVLPCIRKYGCYPKPELKVTDKHTLTVETEFQL